MPDETQRRGLLATLAAQHQALGVDELRVIAELTARIVLGRARYGELDLSKPRDWARERFEERIDALVYDVCDELAEQDRHTARLRERARGEILGEVDPREFAGDQHLTRFSNTPAVLALAEVPRDRDEDLEVELEVEWDLSDVHAGEGS